METVLSRGDSGGIFLQSILLGLVSVAGVELHGNPLVFGSLNKVPNLVGKTRIKICRPDTGQVVLTNFRLCRRGVAPAIRHIRQLHAWLSHFLSYEVVLLIIR